MVMPANQQCPKCGKMFMGSDFLGSPCLECQVSDALSLGDIIWEQTGEDEGVPIYSKVDEFTLLPCPFCGQYPRNHTSATWWYSVECDGCNIRKSGMTAEEAASKWNTRAK